MLTITYKSHITIFRSILCLQFMKGRCYERIWCLKVSFWEGGGQRVFFSHYFKRENPKGEGNCITRGRGSWMGRILIGKGNQMFYCYIIDHKASLAFEHEVPRYRLKTVIFHFVKFTFSLILTYFVGWFKLCKTHTAVE